MAPKTTPVQSSNNVSIPDHTATTTEKTSEEIILEHILCYPHKYIGSLKKLKESLWVCKPHSHQMEHRSVSYVPGLYKIFDDILVNAADNKQRDPNIMDRIDVTINQEEKNLITVRYTGHGIPVEKHEEETVSFPELIFGNLYYDDMEKKATGGRDAFGVTLTNIFSTKFIIEIADGKRQLKYEQEFTDNMSNKRDPVISKYQASDNWTKVSFKLDLAKFNMIDLEGDVIALMKKRVVDLAGCLSACPVKKVRVFLNETEIEFKSFHDYAQFYPNSTANGNEEVPLPRIDNNSKEDIYPRWQISLSRSKGWFQQVSFVNNINTINGGTHVDYITTRITNIIINIVKEENKNGKFEPQIVKNHLWIFVNALIDNPDFDSHQTKERLITGADSFDTSCGLSEKFLKKVVDSSGVVESLLSWEEPKITRSISRISKLVDAKEARGSRSHDCTLILTKGDSAEALAMAWLSVVGRKFFGVFPLSGKLPEASATQVFKNAEINNIKKILGLKQGESYDEKSSGKQPRYGHLMIMADQNHDGSHIRSVLIDIIYTFWPSLLSHSSCMLEFDTPRVKAIRGEGKDEKGMLFYSLPEYLEWVKNTGADVNEWKAKPCKGLGTSDSNEGRECFSNLKNNRKVFVWSDENDGHEIELAFSKKKIDARKDWLEEEENGHAEEEMIKYTYFVDTELKLFSRAKRADLQRSIPSMVDGLKPTQRKVLLCAFEKNLVHEIDVVQFCAYVSEKSSYHHHEVSIPSTIVGMAQDFVGSNNVNLLMPNGQFGTRRLGGKDAARYRYLDTKLADVTRSIFPKDDDVLLDYLKEGGLQIEPVWYMPIIPMVLVNGAEEIGIGWSTFIPSYNPKDIIANIRRLIKDESLESMKPWYRNFKGTIQQAVSESGVTYTVTGTIDLVGGDIEGDDEVEGPDDKTDVKLLITELPIRIWTQDYHEFLETLKEDGFIKSFHDRCADEVVEFYMVLSKRNYNLARQEGLVKKFKLTTSLTTSNMRLLNKDNKIVKYDSPEQILEEFYHLRLKYYLKRKELYLKFYLAKLIMLDFQARFILEVLAGVITVCNKNKAELVGELRKSKFMPIPNRVKPVEPVVGATEDEVAEGSEELGDGAETATEESLSDYDYLLSMPISSFEIEKVQELNANKDKVLDQINDLKNQSAKSLWLKDLNKLEKALEEKDKREAEDGAETATEESLSDYDYLLSMPISSFVIEKVEELNVNKDKVLDQINDLKNQSAKSLWLKDLNKLEKALEEKDKREAEEAKENASISNDPTKMPTRNFKKVTKAKPKLETTSSVAAVAMKTVINLVAESEEEDEDIPDLPARVAAYHLDSSSENLADAPPKQAVSKETLDFVQEGGRWQDPKPVKKGGGGKTQQPAATKKRPHARSLCLPITDETVDASPDKKVRKTRPK